MATKRVTVAGGGAAKATSKRATKAPARASAEAPRVPQPHGGALLAGGVSGNAGGRVPSVLREAARAGLDELIPELRRMGRGEPMPASVVVDGRAVEVQLRPGFTDRRGAADSLAKIGMGPQLSVDEAHQKLGRTLDLLRAELPAEAYARLAPLLRAVWR